MTFYAPTKIYNDAVARAVERDMVDEERLQHFAELVTNMLDALIPDCHDMSHPDARWHPDDLIHDLKAHAQSIQHEQRRLRGPLVLEEE